MASLTSSSSSSSSNYGSEKYDVFLSFRGEDTRKNVLGHLRAALLEKGLRTFVDDDQLSRGQYISTQLLHAIEDSSCSIVIISPNYASSSWCLDELVHIVEFMKSRAHIVIPVFYHIDPSEVRKQSGSFGEAFAKHEKNFEGNSDRVNKWRSALTEITSLVGLDSKNYRDEANFIREIVAEVSSKVTSFASSEVSEDDHLYSKARGVFREISCLIGSYLVIFLVLFPAFIFFCVYVLVPIFKLIIGFDSTEYPDDMVSTKVSFGARKMLEHMKI